MTTENEWQFTGTVSGDDYTLSGSFLGNEGQTIAWNITFSLTSEISGSGIVVSSATDGCHGSFDITLAKQTGDGSGGGGGGGCLISTVDNSLGW